MDPLTGRFLLAIPGIQHRQERSLAGLITQSSRHQQAGANHNPAGAAGVYLPPALRPILHSNTPDSGSIPLSEALLRRMKGLLNVGEEKGPLLLEGVQHVMHAPRHLRSWPDVDRRSRIVFIARDLDLDRVDASLRVFQDVASAV